MTAIAVLTMALGIGASTAVFSVANGVLFRPLPYANPDGLVMIWDRWVGWPSTWLSNADFADYRDKARSFKAVGAFTYTTRNLTGGDVPELVRVGTASAGVFEALGVATERGRLYTAQEDQPGAARVAVISDGLWRRRFAGDPGIVGRQILLDDSSTTVVGIMPADFQMPLDFGAEPMDIWVPLALGPVPPIPRGGHYLNVVARLRPGVTVDAADKEVRAMAAQAVLDYPGQNPPEFGASVRPMTSQVLGDVRPTLVLLLSAVGCVLLIACANVASLLLARVHAREREIAIRSALGASPGRLLRENFVEAQVLALASGVIGIILAYGIVHLIAAAAPATIPRIRHVGIDATVIAFAFLISAVTGLGCGLFPGLHVSRPNLNVRGVGGERVRRVLITAEVALSVVLLVGAGLLLKSFARLQSVDPGFSPDNVLTARVNLPPSKYPDNASVRAFYKRATDGVRALPSVTGAGLVRVLPMTDIMGDWDLRVSGDPTHYPGDWQVISPEYFRVMGIPMHEGRAFTDADELHGTQVIIVNEALAHRIWPNGHAIGQRVRMGGMNDSVDRTVVGVVADIRHRGLDADPRPELYLPHAQWPNGAGNAQATMYVVVRSARDPRTLAGDVRRTIQALDPNLPLADVRTMNDVMSGWTAARRLALLVLAMLATTAVVLAAVGLYGVVGYAVSQRTSEIGIRRALGAQAGSVIALVARQGSTPVLTGIVIGIVGAFGASRLIAAMLFHVSSSDPFVFAAVPVLLVAIAAIATYAPARKAVRVDPIIALRQ
ncbi:MAG TPA: ABC transporter permease [Gemmatimonadaceae bacterium]|nr:ABC transporter permease [Gemmatimonadaceae bacterium]